MAIYVKGDARYDIAKATDPKQANFLLQTLSEVLPQKEKAMQAVLIYSTSQEGLQQKLEALLTPESLIVEDEAESTNEQT